MGAMLTQMHTNIKQDPLSHLLTVTDNFEHFQLNRRPSIILILKPLLDVFLDVI